MKQFISTKFFLALQEASKTGKDGDARILKNGYDEFVMLQLSKGAAIIDKEIYYNTLVYTSVELGGLTVVTKKKMRQFILKKLPGLSTNRLSF